MQSMLRYARVIVVGLAWVAAGSAMAANVFVGDTGGGSVLDPAAIHEFLSTTGDQSQLASGDGIWTDPLDMAADHTTGDVIVLDLGGAAVTHPPRLLRFDGESGVRTEVAVGQNLWNNPLAVTVDRAGDVIVLDDGGGAVFLEPALLRFDGQTGQRSVIAAGQDLWHNAVDLVADPLTGDVFVLDLGGVLAFDLSSIRRFNGLTGAASIVAEGANLWYDATRITADANGDAIVLDLGGAAATALPRLLRFAGQTGDRTEIASDNDLWYNPIDLDVDLSTGDVVVLDRGGGAVFLLPTLRSFDGVTGDASIIADGTDLWVNAFAVAVVPEPGAVTLCLIAGALVVMIRCRTTLR
jgi:hypothetical protein